VRLKGLQKNECLKCLKFEVPKVKELRVFLKDRQFINR